MKIAIDIGGVISKYPKQFRNFVEGCTGSSIDIYIISDMHDTEKIYDMLVKNDILVDREKIFSADYNRYGEGCKAELCRELGIDILIDDFVGYVSLPGMPPVRLLVMPDAALPYYHEKWKTDGSEGDFGRRTHRKVP